MAAIKAQAGVPADQVLTHGGKVLEDAPHDCDYKQCDASWCARPIAASKFRYCLTNGGKEKHVCDECMAVFKANGWVNMNCYYTEDSDNPDDYFDENEDPDGVYANCLDHYGNMIGDNLQP